MSIAIGREAATQHAWASRNNSELFNVFDSTDSKITLLLPKLPMSINSGEKIRTIEADNVKNKTKSFHTNNILEKY